MDRFKLANVALVLLGLGLVALGAAMMLSQSDAPPGLPSDGAELQAAAERVIQQRNCNFCHRTERPDVHPQIRDNCQLCHQYQNRPEHLAPPLERIAERRPADWLRRYLRYPYKLRLHSPDRMPDMQLSDYEVDVLTRHMVALAAPALEKLPATEVAREQAPDPARLAAGRALYDKHACGSCHEKSQLEYTFEGKLTVPAARFAPDLGQAWQRLHTPWLVAAIREPEVWLPWSGMPKVQLSETEAELLAWYVLNAQPFPQPTVDAQAVLAILYARCASCHYGPRPDAQPSMNPAGGAGWIGIWGKPRQLDLTSLEGLMRGAVDDYGQPRPSVVPYALNSPLLMHVSGRKHPQMPFGGDPLPQAEQDLIEQWVLSGARPEAGD